MDESLDALKRTFPACREAVETAQSLLPAPIFHHSVRVWLYAKRAVELPTDSDPAAATCFLSAPNVLQDVLFVSCILHDIGAAAAHASSSKRFEVVGAAVAAALLQRHGYAPEVVREAWLAIAMHSSPHIAEGAGGLVRAVRLAVLADFGSPAHGLASVLSPEVEAACPRLNIEKELGDAVVSQARAMRSKAPGGSWPCDLLRAAEQDPEWDGINKAF